MCRKLWLEAFTGKRPVGHLLGCGSLAIATPDRARMVPLRKLPAPDTKAGMELEEFTKTSFVSFANRATNIAKTGR